MYSLRRRSRAAAFALANSQQEELEIKRAIRLVRNLEKKLASNETIKMKPRGRPRIPPKLIMKKGSGKKKKRTKLGPLIKNIKFMFCNALRRYLLLKRARAQFSLPAKRSEYIALLGGYEDIYESSNGNLKASFGGAHTEDVLTQISQMIGENSESWARRWFGKKHYRTRDCAYIHIVPDHLARCNVTFKWVQKKIYQVMPDGTKTCTSIGKICVTFPRDCLPVKPTKAAAKAHKAAKIARAKARLAASKNQTAGTKRKHSNAPRSAKRAMLAAPVIASSSSSSST